MKNFNEVTPITTFKSEHYELDLMPMLANPDTFQFEKSLIITWLPDNTRGKTANELYAEASELLKKVFFESLQK